jgi:hypothetical protein
MTVRNENAAMVQEDGIDSPLDEIESLELVTGRTATH